MLQVGRTQFLALNVSPSHTSYLNNNNNSNSNKLTFKNAELAKIVAQAP